MLKNYFKTAIRNLLRFKLIAAINIAGLAIGLAAAFIIILFIIKEISFDKYNEKLNNIHIVVENEKQFGFKSFLVPYPLCPALKEQLPELDKAARIGRARGAIQINDRTFTDNVCRAADPDIFNILTLPFKYGDKNTAFQNKNSAVISEKIALKYFGKENAVGEKFIFKTSYASYDIIVTGVMTNIPDESTFSADILFPIAISEDYINEMAKKSSIFSLDSWTFGLFQMYILTKPNIDVNNLLDKINQIVKTHNKSIYALEPLKGFYLRTEDIKNGSFPQGNIENIYIYSCTAFLLLLIACINYIILSIGTANLRTKEIGVRKVIGAGRRDIVMQILSESVLVTSFSIPIAFLLVELGLPVISNLLGKELSTNYFHNFKYVILLFGISFLVAILSGSYISLFLAKYNPVDIFKNKINMGKKRTIFRKVLIGLQMVIFIGLIFVSLVVYRQIHYLYNKDFGFNKDNILVFYGNHEALKNRFDAFKTILKGNPNIINVSGANDLPGTENRSVSLVSKKNKPDEKVKLEGITVDGEFIKTMQMKIVQGENFIEDNTTLQPSEVILNEAAVKAIGLENPVGETIEGMKIIGVVKDFNLHSLREAIGPLAISKGCDWITEIVVKVKPTDITGTIEFIKDKSREFNEGKKMDVDYFDERIAGIYVAEEKFGKVIGFFTGLSIFVAGLGLFGMSLFVIQQRVKEISMRKVLGASYWNIMLLISKEFLLTALIACVITIPMAMYYVTGWMERFAYRSEIDITMIILTALCAIIITIITTGVKVYGAARVNPVNNLRQE